MIFYLGVCCFKQRINRWESDLEKPSFNQEAILKTVQSKTKALAISVIPLKLKLLPVVLTLLAYAVRPKATF